MFSRRTMKPFVVLCVCGLLTALLVDATQAGWFRRCRPRRNCRPCPAPRPCEPAPASCSPCDGASNSPLQKADQVVQPRCTGNYCPLTIVAEYTDSLGMCQFRTYSGRQCNSGPFYNMDAPCRPTTTCAQCNGCFLAGGIGMPPMPVAVQPGSRAPRAIVKDLARNGLSKNVDLVSGQNGFLAKSQGIYRLKQGQRLIELYWISQEDEFGQELDGFGVGFQRDEGNPIDVLNGTRLVNDAGVPAGKVKGWQVQVGDRDYHVYLIKGP